MRGRREYDSQREKTSKTVFDLEALKQSKHQGELPSRVQNTRVSKNEVQPVRPEEIRTWASCSWFFFTLRASAPMGMKIFLFFFSSLSSDTGIGSKVEAPSAFLTKRT